MAYELIETIEVGAGGVETAQFSNIPQDATDLLVLASTRVSSTQTQLRLRFNSSATGYGYQYLRGSGSAVLSNVSSGQSLSLVSFNGTSTITANTFTNVAITIPNYTSSNAKSFSVDAVSENNATEAYQTINAGSWSGTSAITSIEFFYIFGSNEIAQYSTISLYKIY